MFCRDRVSILATRMPGKSLHTTDFKEKFVVHGGRDDVKGLLCVGKREMGRAGWEERGRREGGKEGHKDGPRETRETAGCDGVNFMG